VTLTREKTTFFDAAGRIVERARDRCRPAR